MCMKRDLTNSVASLVIASACPLALSLTIAWFTAGEALAALAVPEPLNCQGGAAMKVTVNNGAALVQFTPGIGVAAPGQCAWASNREFDFGGGNAFRPSGDST